MRGRALHAVLYVVATLSVSSASIIVRLSQASGVANAFWRLLIATVIIGLFNRALYGSKSALIVLNKHTVLAGVGLGLHFALWMDSLFRLPVAVSTLIVDSFPAYTLLIEVLLFKMKVSSIKLFGFFLSILGVTLYFRDALLDVSLDPLGVVESFLSSLAVTVYFLAGKLARRTLDIYRYAVSAYILGCMTVGIYSVLVSDNVLMYLERSWMYFVMLAIVPTIGGHTVMNYLLKYYKPSTVSSITLFEPIGAALLAYVFLYEGLTQWHATIMLLTIVGLSLILLSERKEGELH